MELLLQRMSGVIFLGILLRNLQIKALQFSVLISVAIPFLPNLAVAQSISLLSCFIVNSTVDIFLFRRAEHLGPMKWGRMPIISQYVLILLSLWAVLTMGIMGFIRSGLRENWHIYGVLQDTSQWAFTPTNAYAAKVIGFCTLAFFLLVSLAFWLAELGEKKKDGHPGGDPGSGAVNANPG